MAMVPCNNEGGDGDSNEQRPPDHLTPRNMQDILNFATAHSDQDSASMEPMSEERKQWLNNALSGMFTSEVKIMIEHLKDLQAILDSDTEEDEERKCDLLEALLDLSGSIDNAMDFHKIGGTPTLLHLYKDESSEVRWRALDLTATLVQNNPFMQQVMLEHKAIPQWLRLIDTDPSNTVRVKALYAVSCQVRDHTPSEEVFLSGDGLSVVLKAMQSDVEKLQIKSAFFLRSLLLDRPKFKETLHSMGMVQQLMTLLNTEHKPSHEHLMSVLLSLASEHPPCLEECRNPQLNLRGFLQERIKLLEGKEEFLEEADFCKQLWDKAFGSGYSEGPLTADR